ncbi:serine/threonine-protein kinase [Streptomyces andamanensis]|uniref:non-specific serine/threonine protein kinase n=1 Tax=Streptomyces andamanensis TaxID=1565035 RepID=A0ABV8TAI8_9ACTN
MTRDRLLGGRYRLVRRLGEGGMGQVWEAQDETLDRRVAVKVISLLAGGGSRGGEARARFLREARITARLQHPHIVTVHDLGESGPDDGNAPFLVMELVRGEGLDAKLRRGAVTLEDAARWGAQICDALADAHEAGVLHRDIKPSNILVTPAGAVKVLDFGVARAADPYATADRLTRTGFIVGTPPYMAPEQARGYPEPGSDLYALGCLLFELITGRLPFQAPDGVGYLTAHLSQEPPVPSAVRPGIPGAWDALVLTLLRKDPAERYRTAAEVSRALRQLDRTPEPQPQPQPQPRPQPQPQQPQPLPLPQPQPQPLPSRAPVIGARFAAALWLLIVLAATTVTTTNINGVDDGRDVASGAAATAAATAWLAGCFVLLRRPGWRARAAALSRFALPMVLFGVYGAVTGISIAGGHYHGFGRWLTFGGVSTAALVSLLGLSAALTPRTGPWPRRTGHALVALVALALLGTVLPVAGVARTTVTRYVSLIHPEAITVTVAVLAIAVYGVRDVATRRAARTPPDTPEPPGPTDPPGPETERLPARAPGGVPPTRRLPDGPPRSWPTGRTPAVIAGVLLLTCAIVVSTVYAAQGGTGRGEPTGASGPSVAPVRFTSVPDICGSLSDESFLDTLIAYRRPADSRTTDTERECGWTTESSAPSDTVASDLTIRAEKFATTQSAEAYVRKQRSYGTGLDGSKITELGKPGDFGDEAIIDVYKQDDEKTHGGDTYLSINTTTIILRSGNLCVNLLYARSRHTDGEPDDTSYTHQGAVIAARSVASSLDG